MISFDRVSVTYPRAAAPVLQRVTFEITEGELCLVVGETGSGKSTLLRSINGLVPHFTGGLLSGRVTVDGRDTRTHPPRELADIVGMVGQNPIATFVADTVEDELAYGMECLGLAAPVMRRRVEETLDLLGLTALRHRPLATLSGGEAQRVAIGAVLTAHPRVLVLDEPTSALDPPAAEEVLAALHRLVHDLGLTVVVAEHRLERVVHHADQVIYVPGDGSVSIGSPEKIMATTTIAPAVVSLGRWAGWKPLPMSIRDARRAATGLRERLQRLPVPAATTVRRDEIAVAATGISAAHGSVAALQGIDLTVARGEVVAIMGRNGAGKSTLLHCLTGLHPLTAGRVRIGSVDPHAANARQIVRTIGLVPQEPGDLLYGETVAEECASADRDAGIRAGTTAAILSELAPSVPHTSHPRDLSEGERLTLALSVVLAPAPLVIALDEPTRGLDYLAKARLAAHLRTLARAGHAILIATHDVELAAEVCDRTIVIADGEVVADGPTRDVVIASPSFAPQVAKIVAPLPWLTFAEVVGALDSDPA